MIAMTSTTAVPPTRENRPLAVPSQTDVVVDSVKSMIIGGRLTSGTRLPREKDLAVELGVSRGSLREGVRALCIMGVLETRQGDGTYVTALDANLLLAPMSFLVDVLAETDVFQLQVIRRVLESEAASLAAVLIDDTQLRLATDILASVEPMTAEIGNDHYDAVMEADVAFHRVIAVACGNQALQALIEALATRTVRARLWRLITEQGALISTHREHLAILRAVTTRDPDAARIHMSSHLLNVQEFMRDHPTVF